ncbi:MAG: lipid-A-disaccharide synthase [Candidatus Sumerlaeota bacterium]|nr:lipid-A-disaccharide synthase [Candidatus Sumerlaeota bacterium]
MTTRPRRIFIIAGEASGDLHAANLVRAARARDGQLAFEGLGGPNMAAAGVRLRRNIVEDLAIIGLTGILKNLGEIHRLFRLIEDRFAHEPPDAVLLVDYPGFNLRVARKAKSYRLPVVYYICPQTWAWHESRAKAFPEILDKMLTIFPFEERLFREYGADATFVGHPLLDLMKITMTKQEVCAHFAVDPERPIISLLPGSRAGEVRSLLPIMLEAAEQVVSAVPEAQFVLPLASTIPRAMVDSLLDQFAVEVIIANAYRYNLRAAADFAWVASGTATLETAFLGVPMVILYKTSWLTWQVGKRVINLPYIGLANVVAGERIVPELLQDEATGQNLADRTLQILMNPSQLENMRFQLQHVRERVEYPNGRKPGQAPVSPYDRAAQEFLKALDRLAP